MSTTVPGSDAAAGATATQRARRWTLASRVLKVIIALWVIVGVWLIGFRDHDEAEPVLPDTEVMFSLDLEVINEVDHDIVYAVEQRARPAYRIFSFDPSSGTIETVFTVPADAIVYGIDLSPDRNQLAVAYTTDFRTNANGVWLLDLQTNGFTELVAEDIGTYLTDLEWADMDSIVGTRIDQRTESEQLDVVSISVATGAVELIVENAITPVVDDGELFYLRLDADKARRSIGQAGSDQILEVGDGQFDLDHLIGGDTATTVRVAAIDATDESAISLGQPADAHGNHDVPSTWWTVDAVSSAPTSLEPVIVYDAAGTGADIIYATGEGLSIARDGDKIDLIRSRAIRFITT